MKVIAKSIIFIMAAIAALTSCKKDDTLRYYNNTMGNVVDGTFTSDQGNIFTVVEQNCREGWENMKRAFVSCDVLKKVESTENEYEVRLNMCYSVLTKDIVKKTAADADTEMAVQDPVNIADFWIAGGYVNMYLQFEGKSGSTKKHLVNFVLDEEASTEGKYVFELRHNSYGESLIYNENEIVLGGSFVSFPITDIIKEDSAEIIVSHKWYKSAGQGWSSETQEYNYKISYTKGGYEQAPSAFASKATTNLN